MPPARQARLELEALLKRPRLVRHNIQFEHESASGHRRRATCRRLWGCAVAIGDDPAIDQRWPPVAQEHAAERAAAAVEGGSIRRPRLTRALAG